MSKDLFYNFLTATGVHCLYRMWARRKILIVMYHGVIREKLPVPCWWQLPYDQFQWQIRYLKKHYKVMPLREVISSIQNGRPLPDNTAVITFDDGFENNYTTAYPLLKELNMPATIFIVTDMVGTQKCLWMDEVFMLFMAAKKTSLDLRNVGLDLYHLGSIIEKRQSKKIVSERLKSMSALSKDEALNEIRSQLGVGEEACKHAHNFRLMSWEQVDQIKSEGLVDFGVHSCTHEILSRINEAHLNYEIRHSCERLRSMGPVIFAYPNGRRVDFTEQAKNLLACEGALCALSTISGLNHVDQDIFELKRVSIGEDTHRSNFKLATSGFIDRIKQHSVPLEKATRNIVFLSDCFADTTAGAEKQIVELVKRLDKLRYKVFIVSLDYCGPSVAPLLTSLGCQLKVLRVKRIYGLSGLLEGIRFYQFLKRKKIDIVQTYHFSSDVWGVLIAKLAGVKVIFSNRRDMGFWRGRQHVRVYQLVNRWVSKVIVNARSIRDMVVNEEGFPAEKVEVIYNGVEIQSGQGAPVDPSEVRRSIGIGSNDLVLMQVANLKPVKCHTYVLKAMPDILKEFPNVKLVLIGEDMLDGQLEKEAKELGIEGSVLFLGKRKDVGQLLSIADIGILSSRSEGMSNAILEYMTAGKPVVATNVGGTPEMIEDGLNGLLVPKEDSAAIKEAVVKLLRDEGLRRTLGGRGREGSLERFSMPGMVNNYLRLYDQHLKT